LSYPESSYAAPSPSYSERGHPGQRYDAGSIPAQGSGGDSVGLDYDTAPYQSRGYEERGYVAPDRGYQEQARPGQDQEYQDLTARSETGYSGYGYAEPGSQGPGYPDRGYQDQSYPAPGYEDRGYPEPGYPGNGAQPYPGPSYPEQSYADPDYRNGYGHAEQEYQGRGYGSPDEPARSYPEQGYSTFGYNEPEQARYEGSAYGDRGYEPAPGQPGGYRDLASARGGRPQYPDPADTAGPQVVSSFPYQGDPPSQREHRRRRPR